MCNICKKTKFGAKIMPFREAFLCVFVQPINNVIFSRNALHEHVEYGDLYVNIFPNVFTILKSTF
jgi:hypothetical protein